MLPYYSSDDDYRDGDGLFDDDDMPEEWRFLFHWFEVVANRIAIADAKRADSSASDLGRDPETDWWLDVDHEIGFLVSRYDELDGEEERETRYRTVREALILMSVMAQVDEVEWLDELRRSTRFVPPKWANIDCEDLARRFSFRLQDNDKNTALFGWTLLQDLFGTENYSDQFRADFARLCELATAHGVDVAAMEPIPIRLQLDPPEDFSRVQQVQVLKGMTKTVTKILEIEEKHRKASAKNRSGTPLPPVFRLECVVLDCRQFMFHSTVLKEIQALVETGVVIESLTLPKRYCSRSKEAEGALRLTWAEFVCSITGQPQVPPKKKVTHSRPIRVRRIVMPGLPPLQAWLIPLFSVLSTATEVRALRIESRPYERVNDQDQWRLWMWLGYAFFSAGSSSSVETLEIAGVRMTQDEIDAFKLTAAATDALGALWRLTKQSNISENSSATMIESAPRAVTLPKGTAVTTVGFTRDYINPATVTLPCDWTGMVLGGATTSLDATVDVLLPGFGICRVDRGSIPNKRPRTIPQATASHEVINVGGTRTSAIRTLLLGLRANRANAMTHRILVATVNQPVEAKPFVPQLLELAGRSLTSLSLFADDVDDACLDASLASCPKLRCLRLHGLALATVDPLLRAYTERNMKISSLELRDIKQLPVDEMERFLSHLEPHGVANPIRSHLRKIRFGKGWGLGFRPETVEMMKRILESDDCKLTFIHTHNNYEGDPRMRRAWKLREYRGTMHKDPAATLAFLSVVHRQYTTAEPHPRTRLGQDSIAKILEYALEETSRVVIDDDDMGRSYFASDDEDQF